MFCMNTSVLEAVDVLPTVNNDWGGYGA